MGSFYRSGVTMKKIILILAVVISLILNFIIVDSAKSLSFYNSIEKQSEKVQFAFDKKKKYSEHSLHYFKVLSKKYNVPITKVTYLSDDKVAINTTDIQLKQKADQDKNLNLFDSKLKIKVYDLTDTNLSEEGTYFLSGDEKNVQNIIDLMNMNVGTAQKVDNTVNQHIQIDEFSIILSSLLIIIFFAVFIHFLQCRKYDNKLLYDLGYSKFNLLTFLLSDLKYYLLCYAMINIVLSVFAYILIYKDNHLINVIIVALCTTVALTALCVGLIFIVLLVYTKQYSKNIKQNNPFLMMYTYMSLSIIAVVFLSISTQSLVKNYGEYKNQKNSIKYWDVAKNAYKTQILDQGQVKDKQLSKKLSNNLKAYYNSSDNKGFIIDAENFYDADGRPLYKLNEKENTNIEPDGKTIIIDKNYLKEHRIETFNNQNVLNYLVNDENTQNIIVPVKYKKYKKTIEDNFKDNFTFKKDIENYKGKIDKKLNINIIWVNNQVSYFTYDYKIGGGKNTLIAPIAIIETGNTDPLNFETYFSTRYIFKSNLDNPYVTIKKDLEKFNIDGYIPSVVSVYDTKVDEINSLKVNAYKYTVLALLTGLTFIIMTFTFIRLYFTSYEYKIFIKRNLGYSYLQIHKWILTFLLLVNLLMGILILSQLNIISYFIFLGILLIEVIITYYSFIKLNKENVNQILKGKKDD